MVKMSLLKFAKKRDRKQLKYPLYFSTKLKTLSTIRTSGAWINDPTGIFFDARKGKNQLS